MMIKPTFPRPKARLLELTRTLSLQSGRPSGVDRVCLAYLRALCAAPEPLFGVVRSSLGYVLLERSGVEALLQRLEGQTSWGPSDWLSRRLHKPGQSQRVTEAECRRLCMARCHPSQLRRMLRRFLPSETVYINVDQANLSSRLLNAVKSLDCGRVAVFVHDTIPLDYPNLQTPPSRARFADFLERTGRFADLILTNSEVSAGDIRRHLAGQGDVPPVQVAHLGVEADFFQIGDNLPVPPVEKPYFLMLGTIEPRKMHSFALDLWDDLAMELPDEDLPRLVICGRRGWLSDELFSRLDQSSLRGTVLHEFNDLDDASICGLLSHAAGAIFPSLAEGFGLPPAEAIAAGVPVICNNLPVFREVLGDIPIYASVTDSYAWKQAVIDLTRQGLAKDKTKDAALNKDALPTWDAHFNTVLSLV